MSWYKNLSRRQFLQLGMTAAAAVGVSCNRPFQNPWRFLTVDEARALAAICDQLIPPDHDPGADWARVVNYIDAQLCGPYLRWRQTYREGLAFLDRSSRARFGQPFAAITAEQQASFLRAMETGEFFPSRLESHCAFGVFRSASESHNARLLRRSATRRESRSRQLENGRFVLPADSREATL